MKIKKWIGILTTAALLLLPATPALADDWYGDEAGCYTVQTDDGQALFSYAGQISIDDEYVAADNRVYRVVQVDDNNRTAVARYVDDWVLDGLADSVTNVSAATGQKKIALYCTHSDESYVQGDGKANIPDKGGILDIAKDLGQKLQADGVNTDVDTTPHDPHDAGAYRRSRTTAVQLMKKDQPDMLLDIHRDGIPDPSQYNKGIQGQQASGIRLVLGRSNQNLEANKDMVKKIKAIADKDYPGLVTDVFMGKGSYNQDLTPNSMLIEFGTHTTDKDRVVETTGFVAKVLADYLGASGGNAQQGNATQGANPTVGAGQATAGQVHQESAQQTGTANRASGRAIGWTIGVLAIAGLVFLLIAAQKGGRKARAGNFFKEMTGTGHRDDEHDEK